MLQTKIIDLPIKTGFIGLGYFGQKIYPYLADAGFSVNKIFYNSAPLIDKDKLLVLKNDVTKVDAKLEDILAEPRITTVIIATPVESHYEIAKECLLAGKNVFIEKPTCDSSKELQELMEIARRNKLQLFTDFTFTFSPGIKKCHEILMPKLWSQVDQVDLEFCQYGRFDQGDVIWLLGTHLLSILGLFIDLNLLRVAEVVSLAGLPREEACRIKLTGENRDISIKLSLRSNERSRKMVFGGEKFSLKYDMFAEKTVEYADKKGSEYAYSFDELNNIKHSLDNFGYRLNNGISDNSYLALKVTKLIEKITNF